ncbi:fatty acyl-AMP ligase [Millisia brevis]|uniref:fatty acyl-AMP ligase n=1 Tax=Millisia brevis TaxID=264148 RepID=UPI0012EEB54B|nr:fatty acyl-AMP ligase [Millisia brevis]
MAIDSGTGSIVDRFRSVVERNRERPAITFRDYGPTGDFEDRTLTFGAVESAVLDLAAGIEAHPGDRIALLLPPSEHYPLSYLATLYAGGTAIPLAPPEYGKIEHLADCLRDAEPTVVVTTGDYLPAVRRMLRDQGLDGVRQVLVADDIEPGSGAGWEPVARAGSDLAHLIYTSGSTGTPSAVMTTHRSVLANVAECDRAYGFGDDTVAVSWMPFSFAMCLFIKVLGPLMAGGHGVYFAAQAFIQDPLRWLAVMSETGATVSGAPNFAYERLLTSIGAADLSGIDLGSLRTLINGGERMNPDTMAQVQKALEPLGLPAAAATPSYGCTEASLAAAKPVDTDYVVSEFDAAHLEVGRVRPPAGVARTLVCCGTATGQTLAIVDPDTGSPVAPGTVGEIRLAGDSVADGYWRRPEKTAEVFVVDADGRRWLRSGDLGFLHDGGLYIAGRLKEVVIVNGRNIHPPDVDATVQALEGVLAVAVYGYEVAASEELACVVETAETDPAAREALRKQIVRAVSRTFDVRLGGVDLVEPGAIPRATNGKISRQSTKKQYGPQSV